MKLTPPNVSSRRFSVRSVSRVPTTVNGYLNILRVVMKAARRKYQLAHDAMDGVEDLDTSEHETYTEEEPNALTPDEVTPFVAKFRELYPQHFAMFFLMLVTGLRPSSVRPLRRRGAECDVDWENGRLRVRRSHTIGEEVMRTTKQKRRYTIDLPREVLDVLRWHVDSQLSTPEQEVRIFSSPPSRAASERRRSSTSPSPRLPRSWASRSTSRSAPSGARSTISREPPRSTTSSRARSPATSPSRCSTTTRR